MRLFLVIEILVKLGGYLQPESAACVPGFPHYSALVKRRNCKTATSQTEMGNGQECVDIPASQRSEGHSRGCISASAQQTAFCAERNNLFTERESLNKRRPGISVSYHLLQYHACISTEILGGQYQASLGHVARGPRRTPTKACKYKGSRGKPCESAQAQTDSGLPWQAQHGKGIQIKNRKQLVLQLRKFVTKTWDIVNR